MWFLGETAATVIEREIDGKATYRYLGPRVETQQHTPADGRGSIDEPFIRGYDFSERWSALAHFFVTTQGKGALANILGTAGPPWITCAAGSPSCSRARCRTAPTTCTASGAARSARDSCFRPPNTPMAASGAGCTSSWDRHARNSEAGRRLNTEAETVVL